MRGGKRPCYPKPADLLWAEQHFAGVRCEERMCSHTHVAFDQNIHGTRVVSNPRGYDEKSTEFDAGKVIVLAGNVSIASDA
ncbi:hypothetical protein THIARS_40198 [Thiomonas delicata]|jgi:hypothetical protein|uniref:Uncharacterized protein n=1 Tax=Thiomonas delicata TaxID=364030 RepID=A0A238D009_THIDL|nr:hypothetical protein THIARS_40198 [Thiomonas delicata]